jgi:UDP-N-acetylmuramoylalanine--D-glutamate ligase
VNASFLAGKRVVVVGLGQSGIAACRLLREKGAIVIGTDTKDERSVSDAVRALPECGVTLALGGYRNAQFERADLIVVSPGVPETEAIRHAAGAHVPVWGEVELSVRVLFEAAHVAGRKAPRLIAIGGTNGKSTVTSLVGALLEAGGLRTFTGGNLGEPLAGHVNEPFDAVVLEVSSFQMERVDAFHPDVAVLLNVTPDHLDRYASEADYAAAKGNAFVRQTRQDVAVVPVNDNACIAQAMRGNGVLVTFGPGGDFDVQRDAIVGVDGASYSRAKMNLAGGHNALNVAAALAAVHSFRLPEASVANVLETFEGLPHRMAFVREHAGVRWYDDSKGTNVGAAVTAVRGAREERVVLIAGGRDKGGSYAPLVDALRERGRAAVLLGEAAPLLQVAIGDALPVSMARTMEEAVEQAARFARPGDGVLLSPACSSFDMFRDYKERGDAFAKAVHARFSEAP